MTCKKDGTLFPCDLRRSPLLTPASRTASRDLLNTKSARVWTVSKYLASLAVPALLLAGGTAQAAGCYANISISKHGQAAMEAYQLSIYSNGQLVTSTTAHSWSVELDCGRYLLTATKGSHSRSIRFTASSTVNLEMGEQE